MQGVVEARGVTRRFSTGTAAVTALRDVSLRLEAGGFHILRGPSGSGKTTLMNLLSALDRPTEGSVWLGGEEISLWPDSRRDRLRQKCIGFVFQSVALFSNMTALENVEFGLRIAGAAPSGRSARARDCLEAVGLWERAGHFPSQLSGGEQQRVAIARAVAHRPAVLFADEPTAQLDSRMSQVVAGQLRELAEREGMTVVMTTHDPDLLPLADTVHTLKDGELVD